MIYRRVRTVLLGTGMCFAMFQMQSTFAQGAPPAGAQVGTGEQLGEVVVTATRREVSNQNVPISISVLTNADLVRDQVTDIETLTKMAPNVDFRTGQSPFEQNISIRGIGGIKPVPTVDSPVAYYTDGVYQGLDQGSYNLIDVERVEVLEGPQGTLFGRNTVGGAVSVTTVKPTDKLEGSFEGDWGNYGTQTYTAIVNDPIVPGKLDTRFVYQYTTVAGYGKDYTTDEPTASLAQNYFRGSVKYDPNDVWDTLVTFYSQQSSGYAWPAQIHYVDAKLAPGLLPWLQPTPGFNIDYPYDSRFYLDTYGATGTITGKLNDYLTVKSITGYISTQYANRQDMTAGSTGADGTPLQHQLAYPTNGDQWSQEFQVYGDVLNNRLSYIAGLYYGSLDANQVLYLNGTPYARQNGPDADSKTYAGYGQVTYAVTPKVHLTAGVRFTEDYRGVTFRSFFQEPYNGPVIGQFNSNPPAGTFVACGLPLPAGANYFDQSQCHLSSDVTYHYIPWTVGIDWKPTDDTMLYAKVSKSFRSGAYGNASPTYTPPGIPGYVPKIQDELNALATYLQPVAPSSILSPEVGAKLDFLDHRLRVDGALFYSWYDNVEANTSLPPACPLCGVFQSIVDSGNAHIYGAELEVTALIDKLEVRLVGGYVDPEYVSGVYVGQTFAEISKVNYMVGLSYPIDLAAGTLYLNTNWSWHSAEQQFSNTPPIPNWAFTQPAWGLLDARATYSLLNAPIEFSLYGSNLLNKAWFNSAVPSGAGYVNAYASAPRLFGVSAKYKF